MFRTALKLSAVITFLLAAALSSAADVDAPKLAKPTISNDKGTVSLTTATPDSLIFYSIDNSDPGAKSSPYLAPIELPYGGIIKSRTLSKDRKFKSDVAEQKIPRTKNGDEPAPPSSVIPVTQCREWPGYDWITRHAAVCETVKKKQPKIVFIGDSITHFFGGEPHDKGDRGKGVWAKFYEPRNAVNLGYGWDRTENVLWRVTVGKELEGCAPKVAVVMIGTNNLGLNSPPEIALGIEKICQAIHTAQPQTKILLLGVFPRGKKPDANRVKLDEINKIIAQLDGKDNITYLDFGAKFLSADGTLEPEIMPDALHPSEKGYQIWADAMEPTLVKLLGE